MPVWGSMLLALLSILNGWLMYAVSRNAKRQDEQKCEYERVLERIQKLELTAIAEARFREIIREELKGFELNLINNNQIQPRKGRQS